MKNLTLTLLIAISTVFIAPKKADAGIILAVTGVGAPAVAISLSVGGSVHALASLAFLTERNSEPSKALKGTLIALAAIGGTMLVLDANEAVSAQDTFPTVPSYIFDDINAAAINISESSETNEKLTEVVFSDQEIDSIFELLGESTSVTDASNLRTALKTKTLK